MYVACAESAVFFTYVTLSTISLFDGDGCGCHRRLELRERGTGTTRKSLTKQKETNYSAFTRNSISTDPKPREMYILSYTLYYTRTKGSLYQQCIPAELLSICVLSTYYLFLL